MRRGQSKISTPPPPLQVSSQSSLIQFVYAFFVYNFKQSGTRVRRDLGGVCQDIWNAAPNNMVVGTDLKVDTSAKAVQLLTLTGSGQTKLKDQEYVRFKGKLDSVYSQSTSRVTSIFEI